MLFETQITYLSIILLNYLIGSLLMGMIMSKLNVIQSPHQYGSKNPGATNVFRQSKLAGAVTVIFDTLKAFIPIYILTHYTQDTWLISSAALASVIGHNFPIYFKFAGGKGVATSFGVLAALVPASAAACGLFWVISRISFNNTGIASVSATLLTLSLHTYLNFPWQPLAISLALILIMRHHQNIFQYWNLNSLHPVANEGSSSSH
ncbi:MAG TPA: glycerol-3-phosphate acyltransferase [Gammaproteobacteria bacterium]|nr:glycerol-3-phosphate acyltransferase [Gammaproteobacteria bacterium]